MKKKSLFSSLLVLGLAGVVLAGCGGGSGDSKTSSGASKSESNEKVTIVGSTALQPLVEQAASKYQDANKGAILLELVAISSIVRTTPSTTVPPFCAVCEAFFARLVA